MIPPEPTASCFRLQRQGRVVAGGGRKLVRFDTPCGASGDACAGCWAAGGRREVPLDELDRAAAADIGDTVVLEAAGLGLTLVAARLFGAPLAALLIGTWLGQLLDSLVPLPADLTSALTGVCCLMLAWLLMARDGASMIGMMALTVRGQRMDR